MSQALAGRQLVLVLDTCEHVIGAAAALAEAVLRAGGTLHLLATSREPLRAEGEWVYPVPPLAVPAEDAEDADDLLRYGGVRLFVERLRAAEPHFAPDRRSAAMIAAICRRLDGIPLAIELAAARAAVLGVEEVAAHLDDRFRILTGGRRTALPRHQTLRATLDWSYELLSEPERVILRRLAVFAGVFSLEAASAVIASPEIAPAEVVDGIANLVAKSLVAVVAGSTVARYRLLDTMRAYALEKLAESGEREQLARRHADYYRDLFERAEAEGIAADGRLAGGIRAKDRQFARGARLGIFAGRRRADRHRADGRCGASVDAAVAAGGMPPPRRAGARCIGDGSEPGRTPRDEAPCRAGRVSDSIPEVGVPEIGAAWTKALELAESLGDAEYQLRSLWGLWFFHTASGRHRIALSLAQRFSVLVAKRARPERSTGRRADDRHLAALSGRSS